MSTPPAALTIRPATADDEMALAGIVNNLIKISGTTAHITPFKAERLRDHYITPPLGINCRVAERNTQVLGFQGLEWADPNWQGAGKLPSGGAIIATIVAACHSRQGIGAALFCAIRLVAQNAGVTSIDATIRAVNCGGLRYYAGIGFTECQRISAMVLSNGCYVDRICTAFALQTPCLHWDRLMALYPSTQIQIRPAILQDTKGMNRVLADIFAVWKSNRAYDPGFVVSQYINASDKIACSVAVTGQATVRGFQSLKLAGPNNPYGVTPGWGGIGTYVARDVAKNGNGWGLFDATLIAAKRAGIGTVDTTIGAANRSGLGYYHAMEFTTYSRQVDTVSKRRSVALTPLPAKLP